MTSVVRLVRLLDYLGRSTRAVQYGQQNIINVAKATLTGRNFQIFLGGSCLVVSYVAGSNSTYLVQETSSYARNVR
jgi:hypothetical protein